MARTTIATTAVPTGFPLTKQVTTWVAADVANGNAFVWTGREVLHYWNSDASPRNITVQTVAINGRLDPIHNIAQSIPAGEYGIWNFRGDGVKQPSDGMVYVSADNALVKFYVEQGPA